MDKIVLVDVRGVHASHCCSRHGCTYGDRDCPVREGKVEMKYPLQCVVCSDVAEESKGALEALVKSLNDIDVTDIGYNHDKNGFAAIPIKRHPSFIAVELLEALTAQGYRIVKE